MHAIAGWYPHGRQTRAHYATALNAGRTGALDAERRLDELILDAGQPAIARASALLLLPRYASPASEAAIKAAIVDPSALVRSAVPRALPPAPSRAVVQVVAPLLSDSSRAVRIDAARALAGFDMRTMTQDQRNAFDSAQRELVAAEMVDVDRPEAHLNLGVLDLRRQQPVDAEAEYRTALRLDSNFVPALTNLADLDRMRGQDQQGADLLRKALIIEPKNADVRHSLSLLFIRQHSYTEALDQLRQASKLAPDNAMPTYMPSHSTPPVRPPRPSHCWNARTCNIRRTGMYSWPSSGSHGTKEILPRHYVTPVSWLASILRTCRCARW
jgi:tetratricopeptide (TPR) repeat protein